MGAGNATPCDECPLKGRTKVRGEGPERRRRKRRQKALALLGEAPGRQEIREGKPFVGPAGGLLNKLLEQAGIHRGDCIVTNALLCPIPDKEELGKATIQEAIRCCNRRREIQGDLRRAGMILALGGWAGYALTGHDGVGKVRGCVQHSAWGPCIVTYHPAYLLRGRKDAGSRVQADVFAQCVLDDMQNAKAYVRGKRSPKLRITVGPSPEALRAAINYISSTPRRYALDVEADSLDMLSANLNVVGIAYETREFIHSLVIPWWEGNYTDEEFSRIRKLLKRLLHVQHITMVAHNAQYDVTLIERNLCQVDQPVRDTLIAHKACWPEIRHDLQNVVSQFLLVEPWKFRFWQREKERERLWRRYDRNPSRENKIAWDRAWSSEARELCTYNGQDAGYTIAVWPHLEEASRTSKVGRVATIDSRLAEVTRRMTVDGIPLLAGRREELSRSLRKRVGKVQKTLHGLIARPPRVDSPEARKARRELMKLGARRFNPRSPFHKGYLLDAYDVPCDAMTATGLRSTARRHLVEHKQNPSVEALLEYQDAHKILSTFVEGGGVVVGDDGRLHPSWNAHGLATKDPEKYGTVSGRWASSPNMQNWPKEVRNMIGFKEDDPRVIVSADYSQLELRILALLAGEERLIDVFMDEGRDPHTENTSALFGGEFDKLEKDSKRWTELRRLTKTSTYAWMYGAGVGTMYATINQDFPDISIRQVEFIREKFNEMCPNIVDYREYLLEEVRRTMEIRTFLLGRRRVFPLAGISDPDASVIWNYPIQGTAADIISIRVLKLYPYLPNGTILISQIHDAILLEAMEDKAEDVAALVKKYLETRLRYNGYVMAFPVDVRIGKTWGDT